jgi:hypothetical protein
MSYKSIAPFIFAALSFFAPIAQATNWNLSVSGVLTSGVDAFGVFGEREQDLTGFAYTQTIHASTDPYQYTGPYQGVYWGPLFTTTMTINDRTLTWQSGYTISDDQSVWADNILSYHSGLVPPAPDDYDQRGTYFSSDILLQKPGLQIDFNVFGTRSYSDFVSAYSTLYVTAGPNVYFNLIGTPTVATITTSVPEPSSYVMMLLGLALAGISARRRLPRI